MKQICTEITCEFFQGYKWCKAPSCPRKNATTTTNPTVEKMAEYDPIEIARQYAPKFDKPVVDMVEVVRCRDCKWYSQFISMTGKLLPEGRCEYHSNYLAEDDFCSKGERREK